MERRAQGANSLLNTLNSLFRRGQSSSADEQVDPVERAGTTYTQFQSSGPIQLDQGVEATSFSGSAAFHSHAAEGDDPMLLADLPNDTPYSTGAHTTSSSPQLTALPPTGAFIDSEESGFAHHHIVDDDARSDISMPPLEMESDLEYEEDHVRHGGYDSISESDADAYDVEMHLLVDDGYRSEDENSAVLNDNSPQLPSTSSVADGNHQHVTAVEVEDEDQQRPDSTPLPGSAQPGSSHGETQPRWHPHLHPHPHPHLHPHLHFHPQPHVHIHPHTPQHPHIPPPPQPDGDVRLPNFPTMPGLRAEGQVEGQVPLPGLRTLFQPLIVEAIAQASERFRMAQGAGGPGAGQGPGPTMGPAPGAPIVQVTFDVPVFRVPTGGQTRQQPGGRRQAEHERAFAAPPSVDNPNPTDPNFTPPMPNPQPTGTDAIPPMLRQIFEATFDAEPADPPTADGPQIGAAPGWAGVMGLLFGLGLGASGELHREDPARAKRLVKGLEAVNEGLVKRMGKISEGNADGATCAICWDALLEEHMENTPDWVVEEPHGFATSSREESAHPGAEASDSAEPEPEPEPEEPLPKIIALPCSHVFHSTCLAPWFSRSKQTTCPTCRFNVDPENLTYEPPRRPQNTHQQSQQERPASPRPAATQQGEQGQQESGPGVVPPLPRQAAQHQDGHPPHPPQRRTIFEHTFTIPFSPPLFPFGHPPPGNPVLQSQPEMRQQGPGQQGPFPTPPAATGPFQHIAFQRTIHNLRGPFAPHTQPRMHPPPNDAPAPAQEGPAPPQDQPQAQPPLPEGMQPPPEDGQQNTNGMPRFPGLFQFQLPQFVRMPDGSWFWSAPLGGFPPPTTATAPQAPPGPAAPKRPWVPPPPPGLTLRQRVEQGEREKGLRCDDMSCGLGPSDDEPEPTVDLARVVIRTLGDGAPVCGHTFHPSCLVSAERVAGWGPDSEGERERAGGLVEVSCSVCRAVGVVQRKDWEQGAQALA